MVTIGNNSVVTLNCTAIHKTVRAKYPIGKTVIAWAMLPTFGLRIDTYTSSTQRRAILAPSFLRHPPSLPPIRTPNQ